MTEVQEKELAVFKEIAKICERYNLRYYAIGGTCIGAIRHQGFIPWDDDIDIAMPREDYEKFRTKYCYELPEYLHKLDCDNSKQHEYVFTKIHDSRTTHVELYAKGLPERYTGAFVDVMPVDGLPIDETEEKKVVSKLIRLGYLNARNRPIPFNSKSLGAIAKYIVKKAGFVFFKYNHFSDKILELGSKYDYDQSKHCIFTWRAGSLDLSLERIVFEKKWFESTKDVAFEDTIMKVPADYDAYLRQDFGDYMVLPPKEQQQTHHNVYISDMNTPCSYYAEKDKSGLK